MVIEPLVKSHAPGTWNTLVNKTNLFHKKMWKIKFVMLSHYAWGIFYTIHNKSSLQTILSFTQIHIPVSLKTHRLPGFLKKHRFWNKIDFISDYRFIIS